MNLIGMRAPGLLCTCPRQGRLIRTRRPPHQRPCQPCPPAASASPAGPGLGVAQGTSPGRAPGGTLRCSPCTHAILLRMCSFLNCNFANGLAWGARACYHQAVPQYKLQSCLLPGTQELCNCPLPEGLRKLLLPRTISLQQLVMGCTNTELSRHWQASA